jgi:hypothetical protein
MIRILATVFLCLAATCALSGEVVDTSVCEILANPQSFDGKTVRIKATAEAGFDEFIIKGSGCNQPVNTIWLDYPEGTKAKAGSAAFVQLQLASNNPATVTAANRVPIKLEKNKDFKQFDSLLSTPAKTGGMCLGCIRYTVAATLVGRLDGSSSPGVVRDSQGKVVGLHGFGNLNRFSARLVLQSVSDVSAQEIDYTKNSAASKDESQAEAPSGDPVAAAHQAARAFNPGSDSAEQVERAAAAFGKEGEDNGVDVGFGVVNEVRNDDVAKGGNASPDGVLFKCTFDMDRLKGDALAKAIAHVGAHIADVRDPQPPSSEASLYDLEYRAWRTTVLSAVATQRKTLTLPGGYLAWNASWPADERNKMVGQAISQFLTDWAGLTKK